jgi:hypothetical protein
MANSPEESSLFRWRVKVLIAGDLVGCEDSIRRDQLSCGTPVKPIGRESSE